MSESCNTATGKSRCRLKPFNFAQMGSFPYGTKKFVQFAGVLYFSKISLRLSIATSAQNILLTIFATLSEMAGPKPSEDLRESSIRSKNRSLFSSKSCPPKTLIASSSLLRTGLYHCPCWTIVALSLKPVHVLPLKLCVVPPLKLVILTLLKRNVVLLLKLLERDVMRILTQDQVLIPSHSLLNSRKDSD